MLTFLTVYYVKLHDLRALTTIKQFVTAYFQKSTFLEYPGCLPDEINT